MVEMAGDGKANAMAMMDENVNKLELLSQRNPDPP